jgi:hypothetical protein
MVIERTIDDLKREFGTGTRVRDKYFNTRGVVLCRSPRGALVLWDGKEEALHCGNDQLVDLSVDIQATSAATHEASLRRQAAMECGSAVAPTARIDPFDTGSLETLDAD